MGNCTDTVYLSSRVQPGSGVGARVNGPAALASALQKVARRMAPFYRTVAESRKFAERWSDAVTGLELDRMLKLLKAASPRIGTVFPGTNSIGYFVTFPIPDPVGPYANGTTIPPGTTQSVFEPRAHQAVAEAVRPLYRSLAANRAFALSLAKAITDEDAEAAVRLVRSRVKTASLRSVSVDADGIAMNFRFAFTKYTYRNLLFRDVEEGDAG
ncbi:hypothetical protein [Gorillibacterium sp. sgz5001074]|uniref:hypothetical protein n=1 Tax=Gorillibacterium sp. sgz5001074 TaxID=3446695 RepID=UPI003F6807F4